MAAFGQLFLWRNIMSVELLAPAGDPECFMAAVMAGADAIYVGGSSFGARAYAKISAKKSCCMRSEWRICMKKSIYDSQYTCKGSGA